MTSERRSAGSRNEANDATMRHHRYQRSRVARIAPKKQIVEKINKLDVKIAIDLEDPEKIIQQRSQADEEIRTLDPLLGKEMLYH